MIAIALVLVVATQEPEPIAPTESMFDLATISPHLSKHVTIHLTGGATVTGMLVEVARGSIVVAVPYSSSATKDVRLAAGDIVSFRLAPPPAAEATPPRLPPPSSAPTVDEAAQRHAKQKKAAALDAEARALDEADKHNKSAGSWFAGAGVGAAMAGGMCLGALLIPIGGFVTTGLFAGAAIGCVMSIVSVVIGFIESGAASAKTNEADVARRRAESAMAY